MNKIILLILLALPAHAAEPPEEARRKAALMCGNRANIARQVQVIRTTLGHTFEEYVTNVERIYIDNSGRQEILITGLFVYDRIPLNMDLTRLFDGVYGLCVAEEAEAYRLTQLPSF